MLGDFINLNNEGWQSYILAPWDAWNGTALLDLETFTSLSKTATSPLNVILIL